jgi:hypothetical protein
VRRRWLLPFPETPTERARVNRLRIFIAGMTAVVACVVILWATFFDEKLLGLATAMVPLLTALCTGLLTTEYLDRRAQLEKTQEGGKTQ